MGNAEVVLSLPVLRQGDDGAAVANVQAMLNFVSGMGNLTQDGIFGPRTEAAVKEFQHNEQLAVDGIVGKQTWTRLLTRYLLETPL